ncbi:MAG: universal stress protein, partial [Actinomycetota bacterium]|nr:universal stress protein [Actinomycetota bacterium]
GGWSARDRRELDEALLRNRRDLKKRAEQLEEIARCRPKTKLIRSKAASAAVNVVAEEGEGGRTLLAVGSRGLAAPKRALLGSVSTRTLREAEGSVLIVPPETASARRWLAREGNGSQEKAPPANGDKVRSENGTRRTDRGCRGDANRLGPRAPFWPDVVVGGERRASPRAHAHRGLR